MNKHWLAIFLFLGIFVIYTMPYRDWRLFDDDYVVLQGNKVNSYGDIVRFFTTNSNSRTLYPSNYRDQAPLSFFSVMYRPFTQIMHAIELYAIPPSNPQAYFLLTMVLYALAVVMAFYLFNLLVPISYAFVGALVFAFYPSLGWIGRPAVQPYFVCLLLLGGSLFALQHGIKRQRFWLVWPAAAFFLCALFMQEATAAFPLWLIIAVPTMVSYQRQQTWCSKVVVLESLRWVTPFFVVVALNFGIRMWAYPIQISTERAYFDPLHFIVRLKVRLFDFVSLVVDAVGLTWVPAGNRLRKGLMLCVTLGGLLWIFVHSVRWREMIILCVGFIAMSWLSILMAHQLRYIYLGIPFLIAALLVGVYTTTLTGSAGDWFKRSMLCVAIGYMIVGAFSNYRHLKAFEDKARRHDDAQRLFFATLDPITKPICFIGVPQEWFPFEGTAQAVWLYRGSEQAPVYHDWLMNLHCYDCPTLLDLAMLPRTRVIDVTVHNNVVRLKSLDHQHAWILHKTSFGQLLPCTMGKFTSHEEYEGKVFEATIEIDPRWYDPEMLFVTWDFERQQLVLVPKVP